MNKAQIEDTYAEAFTGIFCRVIVTADDEQTLRKAAEDATASPSVVIGRTEGGVEKYLTPNETPDKRVGAIMQFWGEINPKKTFEESLKKVEKTSESPTGFNFVTKLHIPLQLFLYAFWVVGKSFE